MRTIRSARTRVAPDGREVWLALQQEVAARCADSPRVKGYYLVESETTPGEFWQFVEFADAATGRRWEREEREDARGRALLAELEALVPPGAVEVSWWRQRL